MSLEDIDGGADREKSHRLGQGRGQGQEEELERR